MSPALEEALDRAPSIAAARTALEQQRARSGSSAARSATPCSESPSRMRTSPSSRGREESAARAIARVAGGTAFPLSEEHATWRAIAPTDGWHVDVVALCGPRRSRRTCARATSPSTRSRARSRAVSLIDPTGGVADAEARLLRAASDQALRATTRSGCCVPPGSPPGTSSRSTPRTAELARAHAAQAADPAGERQFAELRGIVAGARPLPGHRADGRARADRCRSSRSSRRSAASSRTRTTISTCSATPSPCSRSGSASSADLPSVRRGSRAGDRRLPGRAARRRAHPPRGAALRRALPRPRQAGDPLRGHPAT